ILDAVDVAAPGVPFAVIGLGKLGAGELNFASDLDVVFVYEGEGPGDFAEAARAAEDVLATIRSAGWEPDADLRPEGRSGPIARSIVAFLEDSAALALSEAFTFLTDVKNALEVDRRLHAETVPPSPEEQVALARRLGYEEYPRQTFLEDYRRITRRARLAMERVFYGEDS